MNALVVLRILGLLLALFSVTMLPPVAISWIYQDGSGLAFIYGFLITLTAGLLLYLPLRRHRAELRIPPPWPTSFMPRGRFPTMGSFMPTSRP